MTDSTDPIERRRSSPSARGRPFQTGNPGRKTGSRNRATIVAEAILAGEEEKLIRKAVDVALGGDVQMLKFLVGRLLPKERPVQIELNASSEKFDPIAAMNAIVNAAVAGRVVPSEASALAELVASYGRVLETSKLLERVQDLERDLRTLKDD